MKVTADHENHQWIIKWKFKGELMVDYVSYFSNLEHRLLEIVITEARDRRINEIIKD
jgi:hypothetical protein